MLLGALGASLLGGMLFGKKGKGVIRAGEGTAKVGYGSEGSSVKRSSHPLTNFEIQMYYQNEPRFNGVFSRDNLPNKIKNCSYIVNLDKYHDIGTHWVALYVNNKTVEYFDSFGIEHIPKEIKKIINNRDIIASIFRTQAYDLIMCGYFCIGFIDFMINGNSLTDFTNLFSSNDFKKNDDIILNYFLSNL